MAQLVKNPWAVLETWVRSLGWEDPLEKGTVTQLQCSGLENRMDCLVHRITKSQTWLSDFHSLRLPRWLRGREFTCQCRRHRRHGFDTSVGKIHWRRKWHPTSVFLPGEFHGQKSLVGYSPWGHSQTWLSHRMCMHLSWYNYKWKILELNYRDKNEKDSKHR